MCSSSTRADTSLGPITVREWHGIVSDNFSPEGKQAKDVVTLTSGERFSGKFLKLNDEDIQLDTALGPMQFKRDAIALLEYGDPATSDEEVPAEEEKDLESAEDESKESEEVSEEPKSPRVFFGGNFRLSGDAFHLDEGVLTMESTALGPVSLPFDAVDSIRFD